MSLICRSGSAALAGTWLRMWTQSAAPAARSVVLSVTQAVGSSAHRRAVLSHRQSTVRVWWRVVTVRCGQYGASTVRSCSTASGRGGHVVWLGDPVHVGDDTGRATTGRATTWTWMTLDTETGRPLANSTVRNATLPGRPKRCDGKLYRPLRTKRLAMVYHRLEAAEYRWSCSLCHPAIRQVRPRISMGAPTYRVPTADSVASGVARAAERPATSAVLARPAPSAGSTNASARMIDSDVTMAETINLPRGCKLLTVTPRFPYLTDAEPRQCTPPSKLTRMIGLCQGYGRRERSPRRW